MKTFPVNGINVLVGINNKNNIKNDFIYNSFWENYLFYSVLHRMKVKWRYLMYYHPQRESIAVKYLRTHLPFTPKLQPKI